MTNTNLTRIHEMMKMLYVRGDTKFSPRHGSFDYTFSYHLLKMYNGLYLELVNTEKNVDIIITLSDELITEENVIGVYKLMIEMTFEKYENTEQMRNAAQYIFSQISEKYRYLCNQMKLRENHPSVTFDSKISNVGRASLYACKNFISYRNLSLGLEFIKLLGKMNGVQHEE